MLGGPGSRSVGPEGTFDSEGSSRSSQWEPAGQVQITPQRPEEELQPAFSDNQNKLKVFGGSSRRVPPESQSSTERCCYAVGMSVRNAVGRCFTPRSGCYGNVTGRKASWCL